MNETTERQRFGCSIRKEWSTGTAATQCYLRILAQFQLPPPTRSVHARLQDQPASRTFNEDVTHNHSSGTTGAPHGTTSWRTSDSLCWRAETDWDFHDYDIEENPSTCAVQSTPIFTTPYNKRPKLCKTTGASNYMYVTSFSVLETMPTIMPVITPRISPSYNNPHHLVQPSPMHRRQNRIFVSRPLHNVQQVRVWFNQSQYRTRSQHQQENLMEAKRFHPVTVPSGWLQLSCGFCVYFDSSSSRMLFRSCT